jgi:response regulator RpfG family c-di-GMP phosphodiesterase
MTAQKDGIVACAEVGCNRSTCFMIEIAARLHDIGRITAPYAVLFNLGNSLMPI